MLLTHSRPLRGWDFIFPNTEVALGNIVVRSNVPAFAMVVLHAPGKLGGATPGCGAWATADCMIGLALAPPFASWFSGRFGDRRVYGAAFILDACASCVCAIRETQWLFVPARIALGCIGGVILPVGQWLALNKYPEGARAVASLLSQFIVKMQAEKSWRLRAEKLMEQP